MFVLMVIVFVLGYAAIALEHPLKIDKAPTALVLGMLMWILFVIGKSDILGLLNNAGEFVSQAWREYLHHEGIHNPTTKDMFGFITHHEVLLFTSYLVLFIVYTMFCVVYCSNCFVSFVVKKRKRVFYLLSS